jgi:mersacidin/lichenicidin family type 2 lantibiotic
MDLDIVQAWKDEDYRRSLNADQLRMLPAHPAGELELTETDLTHIWGNEGVASHSLPTGIFSISLANGGGGNMGMGNSGGGGPSPIGAGFNALPGVRSFSAFPGFFGDSGGGRSSDSNNSPFSPGSATPLLCP